jgi:hypothetical protein
VSLLNNWREKLHEKEIVSGEYKHSAKTHAKKGAARREDLEFSEFLINYFSNHH